jgi:hypothetical protein
MQQFDDRSRAGKSRIFVVVLSKTGQNRSSPVKKRGRGKEPLQRAAAWTATARRAPAPEAIEIYRETAT